MEGKHILLCGDKGAGKSTLIEKLLELNTRPVYGFCTKRYEGNALGFRPVYIHPASQNKEKRVRTNDNLIGMSDGVINNINDSVFSGYGAKLITSAARSGIIIMDELGFFEAENEVFTSAVMNALDGDIPVIAGVKEFDVPFLNAVRSHPRCRICRITKDNRDELFIELKDIILKWNGEE